MAGETQSSEWRLLKIAYKQEIEVVLNKVVRHFLTEAFDTCSMIWWIAYVTRWRNWNMMSKKPDCLIYST